MAVSYTDYDNKYLNKDVLIGDKDFIADAYQFLQNRTGEAPADEEGVYNKFMEHMRFHETNEVTAVRDLMYAQESDDDSKAQFGRLLQTWDRMEGDPMSWQKAGDYIEAGLTAPSTWVGLVTGGAGKVGALTAQQAAKIGSRAITGELLKQVGKSALKSAAVEGGIGLGTGAAQEAARVESGAQEEFTGKRTLMTGAGQALFGTIPGAISGAQQTKSAARAIGLREAGEESISEAAEQAKKKVSAVLNSVKDKTTVKKTQEQFVSEDVAKARRFLKQSELQPLDKEKVKQGIELLNSLTASEKTLASLSDDTLNSLTAAAVQLGKELKVKEGERITSAVSRALDDGKLSTSQLDEFLAEFNLTNSEFSLMYMAEFSRAGKTLARAAQIKRGTFGTTRTTDAAKAQLDRLASSVEGYLQSAGGSLTREEMINIATEAAQTQQPRSIFQELDRLRLSMMTGQLATTVRNTAGGSFRIATDVFDTSFKNMFKLGKEYDDPLAISKYAFFNQAEARVVREMFNKTMPVEADKFFGTFLETATASARLGGNSKITNFGATVNTFNRMSDNMYKQAVFAGRLDQAVRKSMKNADGTPKTLADVIAEGKFGQLDRNMLKDAIEDSLDFVYQKSPTGQDMASRAGRFLLTGHRELPFVVSSLVPFPRFVINQLNFVAQHMPVLGMATAKLQGKGMFSAEVIAKQTTGLGMLSIAYDMRARNGTDSEWYEYKLSNGQTVDMRPIAGPFNAFLLGADLLHRSRVFDLSEDSEEMKGLLGTAKDAFQALGGPQFRAGTGLYTLDRLLEDLGTTEEIGIKSSKVGGRFIGDMLNAFTLPAATFRDFASLADEDMRNIPDTGYTNFWDIIAIRATRSLPEIPGVPEFSLAESTSDLLGTGTVEKGAPRIDMLTGEQLRTIDPLERQIFGFGKRAKKSPLQEELVRLQISPYELYQPADYPYEDRLLREAAGSKVAQQLNSYVQSEEYQTMEPKLRKVSLAKRAKNIISSERERVRARIEAEQGIAAERGESTEYDQIRFETLPKRMRDAVREAYEQQYGKPMGDDYRRALELRGPVEKRAAGMAEGGLVKNEDQTNPYQMTEGDFIPDEEAQAELESAGELAIEMGMGLIPIVGDIQDAKDVVTALKTGDYVGAMLSSVGFIPIVGNALKAGAKATRELIEEADPLIKRRAFSSFVRSEGYLPDLSDSDDVKKLLDSAAKEERIVAGASSKGSDVLFHGSKTGRAPSPDIEKKHAELGTVSLSTSRDPLYSAETFAKGDLENMYVVRPKEARTANLTPAEYDQAVSVNKDSFAIDIPVGPLVEQAGLVTRLPKSMYTEAETIIQDIAGDVDITKLKDNPALFKRVQRGMQDLDKTYDMFGEAAELGDEIRDAASANEFYSKVAKGFKKAQGLGAYTEGAGARGTYDQIIGKIAGDNPDFDGLINSMENSIELLTDNAGNLTQRGEKMEELVFALRDFKDAQDFASAQEAARGMRELKEQIMDITNKMNRGGLASRR
jgi:hypothetical protein